MNTYLLLALIIEIIFGLALVIVLLFGGSAEIRSHSRERKRRLPLIKTDVAAGIDNASSYEVCQT